jgi:cyclopropane-fatty-acyl-phospholipid synthase
MNSKIYTGKVSHVRNSPERHSFSYPVYFYRFDLDELAELDRTVKGFAYNRFSLVRMDDKDYLMRGREPLRNKLEAVLEREGLRIKPERVELITFARYLNIIFRPVSFFICYDSQNRRQIVLAEVHNTFKETHLYILKDADGNADSQCYSAEKNFHVSPFFDINGRYNIIFKEDDEHVDIRIELIKAEYGERPVFCARLAGTGVELDTASLRGTIAGYPVNALLNMPRILRQAVSLYFRKKLPVHAKPLPRSGYTMRKQPPSAFARLGMKFFFNFFEKHSEGRLTVILPEGEKKTLGSSDKGLSAQIKINDYRFFSLIAKSGEIGFGIAFEKGYWESADTLELLDFLLNSTMHKQPGNSLFSRLFRSFYLAMHLRNRNTISRAKKNISDHYDLSNEMYKLFLDESLTYSCAIFKHEDENLEDAQLRKIDTILEKACLKPDHHILEIGTGWGALAIRAASKYGCRVTSITLSEEQQQLALHRIEKAGLSDKIEVQLCDYRNAEGSYDRIISVEMVEAVGKAYLPSFFRCCDKLLKPNGILVIQTITIPDQRYEAYSRTTDWMRLFVFPGGLLPSLTAITNVLTDHTKLVIKNVESIGPHYALTLASWRERFLSKREEILKLGFSESFIRRWEYYFTYCQAGFARHYVDDLQIVLTRPANPDCIENFNLKIQSGRSV